MKDKFKLQLKNWTKFPIESAKLLYDESSDYLQYTVNLSEKITQRAYTFSIIVIAAIGALINTMLSFKIETSYDEIVFGLIILSVIVLFVLGLYLVKLVFPFGLMQMGRQPKEINENKYLAPENLTNEQSHLSFLINEIQNNQTKINYNNNANAERLQRLKTLIVLILVSFFLFVFLYFLIFTLCQ